MIHTSFNDFYKSLTGRSLSQFSLPNDWADVLAGKAANSYSPVWKSCQHGGKFSAVFSSRSRACCHETRYFSATPGSPRSSRWGQRTTLPPEEIVAEFNQDPTAARSKYINQSIKLKVEILLRVVDSNKTYHAVQAGELRKSDRVLLRLPKQYRPTDKLIVTAMLKSSTWDRREGRNLVFDPVKVDEEIEVLPPLWNSTQLLQAYLKSQKSFSQQYEGKTIELTGTVNFVANGGVVLDYVPKIDSGGRIHKDATDFRNWGRPLVTVRFDDDSIEKASLKRGVSIEVRGVVEEMKGGAIIISKATLTK